MRDGPQRRDCGAYFLALMDGALSPVSARARSRIPCSDSSDIGPESFKPFTYKVGVESIPILSARAIEARTAVSSCLVTQAFAFSRPGKSMACMREHQGHWKSS